MTADISAEACLAASCITYADAWEAVADIVNITDIATWRYRRALEAAVALPARCELPPVTVEALKQDVPWLAYSAREWAAIQAGVAPVDIRELWSHMAAANPTTYAVRVAKAAATGRARVLLADVQRMLDQGADLAEVRPLLDRIAA